MFVSDINFERRFKSAHRRSGTVETKSKQICDFKSFYFRTVTYLKIPMCVLKNMNKSGSSYIILLKLI